MRKPHVAKATAYQDSTARVLTTHTLMVVDERDECGSVTIWGFPKGMPQSMGMAITANIESPPDCLPQAEGVPSATIHASHRDALTVHLQDGKLVLDTRGGSITLNEATGLYELRL